MSPVPKYTKGKPIEHRLEGRFGVASRGETDVETSPKRRVLDVAE